MDTLTIINNKEKQLRELYERMDTDEKYLDWNIRYAMRRLDDPNVLVDNVVNVTTNYAGTYVNDLATLISQANVQTVVEGYRGGRPLSPKESNIIEAFVNTHYLMIDENMNNIGLPPLLTWLANHILARGWIGGRYFAYVRDGKYVIDFVPWDCRYAAWEFNSLDLSWASIRTWRYPEDIKVEYPDAIVSGDKPLELKTYYDDSKEEVWCEDRLVKTWNHNRGYVPAVIQPSPAGFLLRGKDYIQHEGESCLFLDRLLFDELNRSVSIEQTLAQKSVLPAYIQESQDPNSPADPYADKVGAQTKFNLGEKPELLPVADFNQAAQLGRRDIFEFLQQGGRNVDIGNINQPFSAIAIANIEDIRKKALLPRFNAIASFESKLSRMMIAQRKQLRGYDETLGHKKFSTKDLDGDYTIKYRFMSKSKELEIANLAVANAAKAIGLPREIIVRDLLLAENPTEIIAKMDSEKAELADPVIMLTRLAHSLVDDAEDLPEDERDAKLIESMMLTERAVEIINQRKNPPVNQEGNQPASEPQVPEPRGNTNMLIPLLGNRGGINQGAAK